MPTNPKQYTDLRTMLDSLEAGALRFFLSGTGMPQGQKYTYLQNTLMPVIQEIWQQQQAVTKLGIDLDCPAGYYECDGCCVPYKCPEISIAPKPKKSSKASKKR